MISQALSLSKILTFLAKADEPHKGHFAELIEGIPDEQIELSFEE